MNITELNIDTILISVVIVLVIVVFIRITVQRYRMSHIKNVTKNRATVDKTVPYSNIEKNQKIQKIAEDSPNNKEKGQNKDNKESKVVSKIEKQEEVKVENPQVSPETNNQQENNKAKEKTKDDSDELDYELLISDPISIFKNKNLPLKHRIAAIREAGNQKLESAVPELIKALYENDVAISLVAAESLGAIGDTRAIDPLLDISKQNDEELYKAAEEYMGGALTLQGDPSSFNFNNSTAEEPEPVNYKEMVVFKVEQLPLSYRQADGCPIPRKELVIKGLNDSNEQMRQMAAKAAIGIEESTEIINPLINALSNKAESEAIRAMAAEALGGMSSDKTLIALIKALKDDDVAIRYAAAKALSGHQDPRAIQALIGATLDTNKFVRASAAYALGTTGSPKALKALIKGAEDENEVVRFSSVKAISSYNFEEVYKQLVEEQTGLERKSQILAKIEILSQFKDKRVINVLRKYLSDIDSEITYKASMALMAQENPEVIDDIIDASKQLDQELYRLAKDKLDPEAFFEITKFNSDFEGNEETSNKHTKNTSKNPSFEMIKSTSEYVRNSEELDEENIASLLRKTRNKKSNKNKDNENTISNDSLFGLNNNNTNMEPVINNSSNDYSSDDDVPLEKLTGLMPEFDMIRKDLLNEEPSIRVKAASQLGNFKTNKDSIRLLRKSIKDENELVRVATVNSLGKIANTEAFNLILSCEKDISTEVRYAVVKALAEIPDYSAAEPLKRMASNDISIDVKRNARIALKKFNFI